jgi:glucose/arabinose dehydrogenase
VRNSQFLGLVSALAGCGALVFGAAGGAPPGYTVEAVHSGLSFPVALRFAPDGRLFYLERAGRIMTCADSGRAAPAEWATVTTATFAEEGLLGLDFHPDFPDSPYVYVFHTPSTAVSIVARLADTGASGVDYAVLFSIRRSSSIHVGGRIAFGPDRMLYVSSGTQLSNSESRDASSLKGKILRLTPMGEPAPGNPFAENPVIAAVGLRNAFGLCFDAADGAGYLTENGDSCDELDVLTMGADYGWPQSTPCSTPATGTQPPLASLPSIAPTGCCVYRGAAYSEFAGDLFFGSWNFGQIMRAAFHGGSRAELDSLVVFHDFRVASVPHDRVTDVTVGPDGLLWISTADWSAPGSIWRVLPPPGGGEPTALRRLKAPPNPFLGRGRRGTGPSKN